MNVKMPAELSMKTSGPDQDTHYLLCCQLDTLLDSVNRLLKITVRGHCVPLFRMFTVYLKVLLSCICCKIPSDNSGTGLPRSGEKI